MRMPVTSSCGNLHFTRSGVVWAGWRLAGVPYHFIQDVGKVLAKASHQGMYQALIGESLILGLNADLDPGVIVESMMEGLDLSSSEELLEEMELSLEKMSEQPLGKRAYWLFVPLKPNNIKQRLSWMLHAADAQVRDLMALPKRYATAEEIQHARRAAQSVRLAIPSIFKPTEATQDEMNWIVEHFAKRGLRIEDPAPIQPDYEEGAQAEAPLKLHVHSGSELAEPVLDEGGQADLTNPAQRFLPFNRRYLKVTHLEQLAVPEDPDTEVSSSYQVLLAMTGTPKEGFTFPGVEFIAQLDQLPLNADFAIRLHTTPAAKIRAKNKQAETALLDQYGQQANLAQLVGGANDLDEVAQQIVEYDQSLGMSESEVEVKATVIFAVADADPEIATAKAQYLIDYYKGKKFTFSAPVGGQEELWWAMVPGIPTGRLVRELSQITTGREFAFGIPLVSNDLGDTKGFLIADNISSARRSPMLVDPQGNIRSGASSSFAAMGEKGGGKSTFIKTFTGNVIDRGGIVFGIDRTPIREYAKFASSLVPENTCLLDVIHPEYSLDTLRIFKDRKEAIRMTQSIASVMLSVPANSDDGAVLARVLKQHPEIESLPALCRLLEAGGGQTDERRSDIARRLADRFGVFADSDLGAVFFDESLPPLPMDIQVTFILTNGLELPTTEELLNTELKQELTPDKIIGRTVYMLCAGIGKARCFANNTELALFVCDECYHMTNSLEAAGYLIEFLRDDRKHLAMIGFGGHAADTDLGNSTLRGLIPNRWVFKTLDEDIAKANLHWLGLRGKKWETIVTTDLSPKINGQIPVHRRGEALVRDSEKRYGKVQVQPPLNPVRREAVFSTPPESAAS